MAVMTVTGPIDGSALGPTLMHEHVFAVYSDYRNEYGWDEEAAVAQAAPVLRDVLDAGIDTIVDMTVWGLGRDVRRLARLSRLTGLRIVAATGLYTFGDLPNFFRGGRAWHSEDFMADWFVRELTEGVADTGIRPAVVKLVIDDAPANDAVRYIARQVALAHLRTGAPIITHSHAPTRSGLEQQRLLAENGVDLAEVVIGHAGDSADFDYLQRMLDAGSRLGMDRFGHRPSASLEQRVDTVVALVERGYASRLVLSHDTNVHSDSVPAAVRHEPPFEEWNFRTISDRVIPMLRERGVTEDDIRTMMVDNPRAILDRA
jgi:phosphotriesterase-related protein